MDRGSRPFAVTFIGCLFVAVGCVGFGYHLREALAKSSFPADAVWIELTELLAVIGGIFLLRGQNWARWLAVAWMAFHVLITALNQFRGFAVHVLLFAGIAWLLFRADSTRYFRGAGAAP